MKYPSDSRGGVYGLAAQYFPESNLSRAEPGSQGWYGIFGALLSHTDIEVRISATNELTDVITDTHSANKNAQNAGRLFRLYDSIINTQPIEVIRGAAHWTGLLAVRSEIDSPGSPSGLTIGRVQAWPISGWPHKSSRSKAEKVVGTLTDHPEPTVSRVARASVAFWQNEPLGVPDLDK